MRTVATGDSSSTWPSSLNSLPAFSGDRRGALERYSEALAINSGHNSLLQKIAFLRRACAPLDERNENAVEKHDADSGRTRAVASSSSTPLSAPPPSTSAHDADERDDDDDDDDCVVVTQRRRGGPAVSVPPAARDARGDAGSDDESASMPVSSVRAAATVAAAAAAPFVALPSAALQLPAAHEAGPTASLEPGRAGPGAAAGASVSSHTALVDGYTCYVDGLATLPGGFGLPRKLFERLYSYQRAGIAWMWSLHADAGSGSGSGGGAAGDKVCGGILADDMGLGAFTAAMRYGNGAVSCGLVASCTGRRSHASGCLRPSARATGKTLQSVAFVSGLLHSERASTVLVGAPLSVLGVWEAEFKRWAPEVVVATYHGAAGAARDRIVRKVQRDGGVLLTTHVSGAGWLNRAGSTRGVAASALASHARHPRHMERCSTLARSLSVLPTRLCAGYDPHQRGEAGGTGGQRGRRRRRRANGSIRDALSDCGFRHRPHDMGRLHPRRGALAGFRGARSAFSAPVSMGWRGMDGWVECGGRE